MSLLVDINERNLFFHRYIHVASAGDHNVGLPLPYRLQNPACAAFRNIFSIVPDPVGNPPHIILRAFIGADTDHLDAKLLER
ncbi:hypothetical protein D3C73_1427990 [compost metagenome]